MTGRFMRADVAEEADVGAANDRLCEALTTPLHARIEDTPGDAARALEAAIWAALRQGVMARRISSANF